MPALLFTVMFAGQLMLGAMLSTTVTTAVHVLLFPLGSVTVRVTLFGPRLLQLKLLWLIPRLATLQWSNDPPSMVADVMLAWPVPSK